jgi:hypothetical protein
MQSVEHIQTYREYFQLVRKHASLNGLKLCLNRTLWGQFLREICSPFSGAVNCALAWKLLTPWASGSTKPVGTDGLEFNPHTDQICMIFSLFLFHYVSPKFFIFFLFYLKINAYFLLVKNTYNNAYSLKAVNNSTLAITCFFNLLSSFLFYAPLVTFWKSACHPCTRS